MANQNRFAVEQQERKVELQFENVRHDKTFTHIISQTEIVKSVFFLFFQVVSLGFSYGRSREKREKKGI